MSRAEMERKEQGDNMSKISSKRQLTNISQFPSLFSLHLLFPSLSLTMFLPPLPPPLPRIPPPTRLLTPSHPHQFTVKLNDQSFHAYKCDLPSFDVTTTKAELMRLFEQMVSRVFLGLVTVLMELEESR